MKPSIKMTNTETRLKKNIPQKKTVKLHPLILTPILIHTTQAVLWLSEKKRTVPPIQNMNIMQTESSEVLRHIQADAVRIEQKEYIDLYRRRQKPPWRNFEKFKVKIKC